MKRSLCDMNEVNLILFFLEEGPIEPPPPLFFIWFDNLWRGKLGYTGNTYIIISPFYEQKKKKKKEKKKITINDREN